MPTTPALFISGNLLIFCPKTKGKSLAALPDLIAILNVTSALHPQMARRSPAQEYLSTAKRPKADLDDEPCG